MRALQRIFLINLQILRHIRLKVTGHNFDKCHYRANILFDKLKQVQKLLFQSPSGSKLSTPKIKISRNNRIELPHFKKFNKWVKTKY